MPSKRTTRFLVVELYRLGDGIYSWCLADALARLTHGSVEMLSGAVLRPLPIEKISGISRTVVPAPWVDRGWARHPFRLVKQVGVARRLIKTVSADTTLVLTRVGIPERLLLFPSRLDIAIRPRLSAVSLRSSAIDVTNEHPMIVREQLFSKICPMIDGVECDRKLSWPFLASAYKHRVSDRIILLAPEAGNQAREWPIDRWITVAERLTDIGIKTVFIVTRPEVRAYLRGVNATVWSGSVDHLGGLIGASMGVVAVDSFVGHFAAAIGTPVFTLFGPQDPRLWKHWGFNNEYIQDRAALGMVFDSRGKIELIGPKLMHALGVEAVLNKCNEWINKISQKA